MFPLPPGNSYVPKEAFCRCDGQDLVTAALKSGMGNDEPKHTILNQNTKLNNFMLENGIARTVLLQIRSYQRT